MPYLTKEKKRRVEDAFHAALEAIKGRVRIVDFPRTIDLLQPRLTNQTYEVHAFKTGFTHDWHGDVKFQSNKGEHVGAVLTTMSPKVVEFEDMHAFERAALNAGNKTIMFHPREDNLDAGMPKNITSFAKLILHYRGTTPVLFLTTLQKTSAWSRTKRTQVDKREGEEGIDRHFLHIGLAEKVAAEMKKRGIAVEVHVPAPRHIVEKKYSAPFKTLSEHFEQSRLKFSGGYLNTVNLSAPRKKR